VQPLLQWKSNYYYTVCVCICSLRYPACNAHAPYYHLWPTRLYNIFPHYPQNGTIFEKYVTEHKMCVSSFSTTFARNIYHLKKNWERCDKKIYIALHVKYPLFLSDLNATWIFSTYFRNKLKVTNFMKIRPLGTELFHADGQTWRS